MIFADTDILSALAKIGRLSVLYTLMQTTVLYITPSVLREIEHSFILRRQYAIDLFALLASGQIEMVRLSSDEVAAQNSLPHTLGAGERESIAAARVRAGTVLSNESRVAHICQQHGIFCLRLPELLRAFWMEDVMSKQEVQKMVRDLQDKDGMRFRPDTLRAIFAE